MLFGSGLIQVKILCVKWTYSFLLHIYNILNVSILFILRTMKTFLKLFLVFVLCGTALSFCKKKPSKSDIEQSLITAMSNHLNSDPQIDTSVVKFKVLSVTYFEEVVNYACEFRVEMKTNHSDTTGLMTARVSKNFEKVIRRE